MERLNHPVLASSAVSLTTSVVQLTNNTSSLPDRQWISFPVYSLTGTLYILPVSPVATAPDSTAMQNYGLQFTSADKVVQLNLGENMDVYAMLSTGTFSAYVTEWQ